MAQMIDSWGGTSGDVWRHPLYAGEPSGPSGIYTQGPTRGPMLQPVTSPPIITTVNPVTGTTSATGQTIDPTTGLPTTSQAPAPAAGGFDLSSLTSMTILGIPVLWIGVAAVVYFVFLKKGR